MTDDDLLAALYGYVVDGESEDARDAAARALAGGIPPLEIINRALVPAIREVGDRFQCGDYFLPELMMSAEAMDAGMAVAEAAIEAGGRPREHLGTVVLGTVAGDIHEIGKNLVGLLLRVNGFRVHDLGVDVPTARFVEEARVTSADIVGISTILTSLMSRQQEIVEAIRSAGIHTKILVGGAPINWEWARRIGADGYSPDAVQAVQDVRKLLDSAPSTIGGNPDD